MKSKLYAYFLVFLQFLFIVSLLVINESIFSSIFCTALFIVGLGFGMYTLLYNTLSNFNISPLIKKDAKLITKGAYRFIRHPMYFSVLIMMLAVILVSFNVLSLGVYCGLMVVLYLKAQKEEKLWMKSSSAYQDYKEKTKMFIPFIL